MFNLGLAVSLVPLMPRLKFNVFDLMPRSATHYVLPAAELPVVHRQAEIGRTDIDESGDFQFDVSDALARDITTGNAIVLPTSSVVPSSNGSPRLRLISVELHPVLDSFN